MAYAWMGMNYGNSTVGYIPNTDKTATFSTDLKNIHRLTRFVRIAMPDWNFPSILISQMKTVALKAKAEGLYVSWGLASTNTQLTRLTWPAYRSAVVKAAQWAQQNGIDEFLTANELDKRHDLTITAAEQRNYIRSLAAMVKAAGFTGKVSVSISQDHITHWYGENFGSHDGVGLNLYMPDRKRFTDILRLFRSELGTRAFVSEWNIVNNWNDIVGMTDDDIASRVSDRVADLQASGIARAYYFTYNHINYNNPVLSDNAWAAHLADGSFRKLWPVLFGA